MKIAVYSAITWNDDTLKTYQAWGKADWFMFTDQPISGGKWQVIPVKDLFKNPRRNARLAKTTSHKLFPEYDYTIWIDGSMQLNITPEELIKKHLKDGIMGVLTHPDRDCPYDEAEACIKLGKDSEEEIRKQMANYLKEGFMPHQGLGETKIVIRKNCGITSIFNDYWTLEILNHSLRDQLSFNYCAKKCFLPITYIESWKTNKDIKYIHHVKNV